MINNSYGGTANATTMKSMNAMAIMRKIVKVGNITRAEIASQTKLTKSTVSSLVSEFIAADLVVEKEVKRGAEGRPGILLDFNFSCGSIISLIFDYNSVRVVVLDLGSKIYFNEEFECENMKIEDKVIAVLDELFPKYSKCTYGVVGIMVGVMGTVDNNQKVKYSPLNEFLSNTLKPTIEQRYNTLVYLDKLGNLLASSQGIHAWKNDICNLAVNIHTAVDMGAVINDELYRGYGGTACELAHTILVPNGRDCSCGNRGCVEQYISSLAVLRSYEELSNAKISLIEFVKLVNDNDATARAVYDEFMLYTSVVLNNAIALFSPRNLLLNSYIVSKVNGSDEYLKSKLKSKIIDLNVLYVEDYNFTNYILGTLNFVLRNFIYKMMYKN